MNLISLRILSPLIHHYQGKGNKGIGSTSVNVKVSRIFLNLVFDRRWRDYFLLKQTSSFLVFYIKVKDLHENNYLNQKLKDLSIILNWSKIYIFDSDLFLYTRNLSNEHLKPVFEYKISFWIYVLVLWIHRGYYVVKKLVWNVRIKAFWYTNTIKGLRHQNLLTILWRKLVWSIKKFKIRVKFYSFSPRLKFQTHVQCT